MAFIASVALVAPVAYIGLISCVVVEGSLPLPLPLVEAFLLAFVLLLASVRLRSIRSNSP